MEEGSSPTTDIAGLDLSFLEPPGRPGYIGRFERYDVLESLGHGATGIVLKAEDSELHRIVAVKVLHPVLATSAVSRKRFLREARAAAAITHEHVVALFAVGECSNLPFLVMEYVRGRSLEDRIRDEGPLPLPELLRIAHQIAGGLAAAHAQGLVHRDIKPANILLENGVERVKITDFGLARSRDDGILTVTGFVAGTPEYMAPEQLSGAAIDERSDLFSLGTLVYSMAGGCSPFRSSNLAATLRKVTEAHPTPLTHQNPNAPPWLAETVQRLMAKDPARRPQSATEVASSFAKHLADLQRTPSPAKPHQRGWLVWTAAVTTLVTAGWIASSLLEPPAPGPAQAPPTPPDSNAPQTPTPPEDAKLAALRARWVARAPRWGIQQTHGTPDLGSLLDSTPVIRYLAFCPKPGPGTPPRPQQFDLVDRAREAGLPVPGSAFYIVVAVTERGSRHATTAPEALMHQLHQQDEDAGVGAGAFLFVVNLDQTRTLPLPNNEQPGHEIWLLYPGDPSG